MNSHYQVLGFWFYHELDNLIGQPYVNLTTPNDGIVCVKGNTTRLKLLKNNPECIICNRVGTVWFLQKQKSHKNTWDNCLHLGLYWIGKSSAIQMTKDHKIPSSKGGSDSLNNMQTFCEACNQEKGNSLNYKPRSQAQYRGRYLSIYHEPQRQTYHPII